MKERARGLVIFDCDGVLVDSEAISNRTLAETICKLGWEVTETECLERFRGVAQPDIWNAVCKRIGEPLPVTLEQDFRRAQYRAFREVPCEAVAGVHELLAGLERIGQQFCVASNGPLEKLDVVLGVTGLLRRFSGRIFSRVQVSRPKPAPDLFLHAAHSLGAEPAQTLVIEDSTTGVIAARAAGMQVFGFAGTGTCVEELMQAGATMVASSMWELRGLLCEHSN